MVWYLYPNRCSATFMKLHGIWRAKVKFPLSHQRWKEGWNRPFPLSMVPPAQHHTGKERIDSSGTLLALNTFTCHHYQYEYTTPPDRKYLCFSTKFVVHPFSPPPPLKPVLKMSVFSRSFQPRPSWRSFYSWSHTDFNQGSREGHFILDLTLINYPAKISCLKEQILPEHSLLSRPASCSVNGFQLPLEGHSLPGPGTEQPEWPWRWG